MPALIKPQTKLFFIMTFIVIVTACSFKTLYNRLDYLIPSYVEGMVTLDDALEEKIEQRTLLLINWHRNTQLRQYADWLKEIQLELGPELTATQLQKHIVTLETFWSSLSIKVNEEMVVLLPLLDAGQRDELFESIVDKNDDFRDDYIDLDESERIESYTDSMLDTYENWLGDLTEDQQQNIETAAGKLHSGAELRLQQRLLWQRSIKEIIDNNDPGEKKSERLRRFLANFDSDDNARLLAVTNTNKHIITQLTLQIAHSLTAEQKRYFFSKTDDYIRIFTELAENR